MLLTKAFKIACLFIVKAKTFAEVVKSRPVAGIHDKTLAAKYKVITLFYVLCELLGISNA